MTNRIKIYLDTSVINFLFADDAPQYQQNTIEFFEDFIKIGHYQTFISAFVLDEIENNPNESEKHALLKVIVDYNLQFLENTTSEDIEIRRLAQEYIKNGVIPPNKLYDALHITTSVFNEMDYLVSWNFKHLANVNKEMKAIAVNLANGYFRNFHIVSPIYLLNDEIKN
jgi:predicted nucleic acid-binding protein